MNKMSHHLLKQKLELDTNRRTRIWGIMLVGNKDPMRLNHREIVENVFYQDIFLSFLFFDWIKNG